MGGDEGVPLQKGLASWGKGQGHFSSGIREAKSLEGACSDAVEWIPVETRQDRGPGMEPS